MRRSDVLLISALGQAAAAALAAERVPLASLVAAARTAPGWRAISPVMVAKLLRAAGWQPRQWRLAGGRVRGYAVPSVTTAGLEPARQAATRACSRPQP